MGKSGRGPDIVTPEVLMELTAPHIDSFDYFVDRGLAAAIASIQPVEVDIPAKNLHLRIWLDNPAFLRPTKEFKNMDLCNDPRLLPSECRMGGTSYKAPVNIDVCFQYSNGNVVRQTMPFGRMPIMVKSSLCHLRGLKPHQLVAAKEEALEAGGYFICNGIERIIRLLIVPKRNIAQGIKRNSYRNRGPSYSEYAVLMRCVRQDQSGATNRLYYLNHGSANLGFSLRRQEFLIPAGLVLKALIDTSDREIFDSISSIESEQVENVTGVLGTQFVSQRARILLHEVKRLNLFTRIQCLEYIGERFKHLLDVPKAFSSVKVGEKVLEDFVFEHIDNARDKYNLLIFMLHKLYALADGLIAPDNVDALQHQEILTPGHLLTIFVKERLQEWLVKVKAQLLKEAEELLKFNLQDMEKVLKVVTLKVPSGDVLRKVDYLLNTGNLASQTGLDLQQATGFTVVADKLNFLRYISHFRSVHRGAFFSTLRTTTVRKLLPESWGFLCPVHTPDGAPCGLLTHLTAVCAISSDLDSRGIAKQPLKLLKAITSELVSLGMLPAILSLVRVSPPTYLTVQLDGRVLGHLLATSIPSAVTRLRHLKVYTNLEIPEDLEVAYVPWTSAGAYPGLYLSTTPGRFLRPVKQLGSQDKGAIELIGPFEQGLNQSSSQSMPLLEVYLRVHCRIKCMVSWWFLDPKPSSQRKADIIVINRSGDIRCPDGDDRGSAVGILNPTHEETHALTMLSVVAGLTPWSDHNQSPRNMYQCQMAKQTMGTPAQAIAFRPDNKLYRIQTPQSPVVRTQNWNKYNVDQYATGTNAIVAVLSYTGYDMEDAMILNKSSVERGFCHGQVYKTEIIDLSRLRNKADGIINVFGKSEDKQNLGRSDQTAEYIDVDGLPYIGQVVTEGKPYCSVINSVTKGAKLSKLKGSETVVVDSVAAIGQGLKEPLQKVAIRMRQGRNPIIGDKFSSRHGQKGVLSQLWPDADMPFSAVSGMRPDLIINPHAFPSRMTIGMLLESMAAKVGTLQGSFVDATPFQKCNTMEEANPADGGKERHKSRKDESPVDKYGEQLKEYGFNYHGTEVMYSGVLGTELTCEIYLGIVYYQRLRHMVSDKYQVRSLGPVNPVTRQPVKGRKQGGGVRFGEMERDSLLAHGAAYLLHDRLHKCSDYHIADLCTRCGSLLAPTAIPPQKTTGGQGLTLPLGTGKASKVICRVCNSSRDIESVAMPFVFRYLAAELAAMNIKLTLSVSDD